MSSSSINSRVGTRSGFSHSKASAATSDSANSSARRSSSGLLSSSMASKDTDRGTGFRANAQVSPSAPPLARPKHGRALSEADEGTKPSPAAPSTLHPNNLNLDLTGGHRVSCHRCGNMRKKNVLCNSCPHIFCQRCSEKLLQEWGATLFDMGCIVCKHMCCCADPRDTQVCNRTLHCYKKCVAEFKNKPAGSGTSASLEPKPVLVDSSTAAAIVQRLVDRDEGAMGGSGDTAMALVDGRGQSDPSAGPQPVAAKAVKTAAKTAPAGTPRSAAGGAPPPLLRPTPPTSAAHTPPPALALHVGRQEAGADTAEGDMDQVKGEEVVRADALGLPLHSPMQESLPGTAAVQAQGSHTTAGGVDSTAPHTGQRGGHSRKRSAEMGGLPETVGQGEGSRRVGARMGPGTGTSPATGLHASLDPAHPLARYGPDESPVPSEDARLEAAHERPGILVGLVGGSSMLRSGRGLSNPSNNPFNLPLGIGGPMMTPLPLGMPMGSPGGTEEAGGMTDTMTSLHRGLAAPLASLNSPGLQLGIAAGVAAGMQLMQAAQFQQHMGGPAGQGPSAPGLQRGDTPSLPGSTSTSRYGLPLPSLVAGMGMGMGLGSGGTGSLATPLISAIGTPQAEHFRPNAAAAPTSSSAKQGSGQGSAETWGERGERGTAPGLGLHSLSPAVGKSMSGLALEGKGGEQDAHIFADLTPLHGAGGAGFR